MHRLDGGGSGIFCKGLFLRLEFSVGSPLPYCVDPYSYVLGPSISSFTSQYPS